MIRSHDDIIVNVLDFTESIKEAYGFIRQRGKNPEIIGTCLRVEWGWISTTAGLYIIDKNGIGLDYPLRPDPGSPKPPQVIFDIYPVIDDFATSQPKVGDKWIMQENLTYEGLLKKIPIKEKVKLAAFILSGKPIYDKRWKVWHDRVKDIYSRVM